MEFAPLARALSLPLRWLERHIHAESLRWLLVSLRRARSQGAKWLAARLLSERKALIILTLSVAALAIFWLGRESAVTSASFGAPRGNAGANERAESVRLSTINPAALTPEQRALTLWIAKRYRVTPHAVAVLVAAAWEIGARHDLEPVLLLAVMAVESNFNPFAQSRKGAEGIMQVLPLAHPEKYVPYGGIVAGLDPVINMSLGAKILRTAIDRSGSVPAGLKAYSGAANLDSDAGYAQRVLAERDRMRIALLNTPPRPR